MNQEGEVKGGYTQHQLDLILGRVNPQTPEEIDYVMMHGDDVLPNSETLAGKGKSEVIDTTPSIDKFSPQGAGKLSTARPQPERGNLGNYNADRVADKYE
jgi:hypothetical protein